jgi:hypothetical protein
MWPRFLLFNAFTLNVDGGSMSDNLRSAVLVSVLTAFISASAWTQVKQQVVTLVVNGQSGQAAIVHVGGRGYVDLAALARIANGSLDFQEKQIVLTLPQSNQNGHPPASLPDQADESSMSRDFMKEGIETITLMREWASPLAYAIQNGYNVTDSWVAGYRGKAANGLRIASVAAKTNADHNALQLLTNEFEALREWSNKLVEAHNTMNAGKYSLSEDALRNEPLSQKIVTCGHFLASMLAGGSFQDDASCH